jgi:hypothetical protein
MEYLYRFAGFIAPINRFFARYRTNFIIPANWLLMFALGVFVALNAYRLVSLVPASQTAPQSVGALLSDATPPRGYVTVTGRLRTEGRVDTSRTAAGGARRATFEPRNLLVPLTDRGTGKGILVRIATLHPDTGEEVALEGMLRPIPPDLARQLAARNYTQAGFSVDRRVMLVEGRRPGTVSGSVLGLFVSGTLLAAFVWASFTRNVIFMPVDSAPGAGMVDPTASAGHVLVSGTMVFEGKRGQVFTNMPAVVVRLDTGQVAIASHIETSSNVMGFKTTHASGVWALTIQPGSITGAESGHMFWGRQKLRAFRFHYVDGVTGKVDRAVIASATGDPGLALAGA